MARECILYERNWPFIIEIKRMKMQQCLSTFHWLSFGRKKHEKKPSTKFYKQHKRLQECASFIVNVTFFFSTGSQPFFSLARSNFHLHLHALFCFSLIFSCFHFHFVHLCGCIGRNDSYFWWFLCVFAFFLCHCNRAFQTHGGVNEEEIRCALFT